MDGKYLIEVCRKLLAPARAEVFAVQVSRTLLRIAPEKRLLEIHDPQDVVHAFQSKGLIPALLIYLCGSGLDEASSSGRVPDDETLALCFAACAYPQRPRRMAAHEIRLRVESFARFYREIVSLNDGSPEFLSQIVSNGSLPSGLTESFSANEIRLLLSDLCAGDWVANPHSEDGKRQTEERLTGAFLYLATCYPDTMRRTRETWLREWDFVRYFKKYLFTSPSEMASEDDLLHPDWSRVRAKLTSMLPDEQPDLHNQAVILEQTARNCLQKFTSKAELGTIVVEFWQSHKEKLISGFPYYAFRSRFVYWWKQCATNYSKGPTLMPLPPELPPTTSPLLPPAHNELTPEELRLHHEGYRLVRATFFPREDRKTGDADIPMDDNHENEMFRRALDEIWYHRLQAPTEEEFPRLTIKQIVERHPFLKEKTVYVLTHRIRLRLLAYTLARLKRLSNDKIRSAKKGFGKRRNETPLVEEPGVLTIASLARMISTDETLLWAFTAHIFLHPKVVPQRPSFIQFHHYMRELWWWVNEETFDGAIERGAAEGSPSHKTAQRALRESAVEKIITSLRNLKRERELDLYLSDSDFTEERGEATRLVDRLLDSNDVFDNFEKHVRDWRKKASQHWIIPVWYLMHIEQLKKEDILSRLIVDDRETRSLVDLYQAMGARR